MYSKLDAWAPSLSATCTVAVCGPPISADYYFPKNFRYTRLRDRAEFFIAFTKDNCDRTLPGRKIYEVERLGVILSVVLDRRPIVAKQIDKRPAVRGLLPPT